MSSSPERTTCSSSPLQGVSCFCFLLQTVTYLLPSPDRGPTSDIVLSALAGRPYVIYCAPVLRINHCWFHAYCNYNDVHAPNYFVRFHSARYGFLHVTAFFEISVVCLIPNRDRWIFAVLHLQVVDTTIWNTLLF